MWLSLQRYNLQAESSLSFPLLRVRRHTNRGVRGGRASHTELERDSLLTCLCTRVMETMQWELSLLWC